MAGNYPDVPSWRMALDRDGTQGFSIADGGSPVQLDTTALQYLTNEDQSSGFAAGYAAGNFTLVLIFPELRDLDGFFICGNQNNVFENCQTSVNSTNGVDGTWVALAGAVEQAGPVAPKYRTSIQSATVLGIKALRFHIGGGGGGAAHYIYCCHLYGEISPGQNPNRLMLWHPTLDERVGQAYFDWGNVPRSSSADKTFRVKNNSATLTASAVRIAMDVLTDGSPSVPGQHSISKNGTTFGAQQTLTADLAPGVISPVLTLRRVTPTNAQLSVWAHRVFAEASGWA